MLSPSLLIVASLALAACVAAQVQFLGVAIAGGDFGCQIDGTCPTGSTQLPLGTSGGDGPGQMQHWTSLAKPLNMFRLPISWQFLVNNQLGAALDATNLGKYDQLVQACLGTGAHCMIDIHNFARFNNAVIGQGGPTDDQFVSLWAQLATKYAAQANVVFELMNEPHDLDVGLWAATCQKAVAAIRGAGATGQMILLPGTNFDSAATLVSSGSAAALMNVTNPDGTTDNLLLDIHKYLDEDNSGTHAACTTNNVDSFTTVAQFLRQAGRKGFVSESGASSDASCLADFCAQNTFINQNADVFVGLVGWGAGSFSPSYVLSLTPTKQNGQYVDNALMQQCLIDVWASTASTASGSGAAASTAAPTSTTAQQSTVSVTPVVVTTVAPSSGGGGGGRTMTMTMAASGTSTVDLSTAMSGTDGGDLLTATDRPAAAATATGGAGSRLTATGGSNSTAAGTAAGAPVVTASGSSSSAGEGLGLVVGMMLAAAAAAFSRRF